MADIPDEQPPLAEIPDEDVPLVDLPDEDVPLAAVPRTGDETAVWFYLAILSAACLLCLAAVELKKSKKN